MLVGIRVDELSLARFAGVLNCKCGRLPFVYLGIPIRANPRNEVMWEPVIRKLKSKLAVWKQKSPSIGGRLTLTNSVLASLPLYYASFFKIPPCVIKKIFRIQRGFLWGGEEDGGKVACVKWDDVCVAKGDGWLGIKNIKTFNVALFGKWRCRPALNQD